MKIITGIASTSHVDLHGDVMTKQALDSGADQINDHYIPIDVEHKGIFIGVQLAGFVKQLDDGEWGLYFVGGIFDNEGEKANYPYKTPNTVWKRYIHMIDGSLDYSFYLDIDDANKKDLLSYFDQNGIKANIIKQKALDVSTVIVIAIASIQTGLQAFTLIKDYMKSKEPQLKESQKFNLRISDERKGRSIEINLEITDNKLFEDMLKNLLK